MLEDVRADVRALRATKPRPSAWFLVEMLLFENGFQAVLLYRILRDLNLIDLDRLTRGVLEIQRRPVGVSQNNSHPSPSLRQRASRPPPDHRRQLLSVQQGYSEQCSSRANVLLHPSTQPRCFRRSEWPMSSRCYLSMMRHNH